MSDYPPTPNYGAYGGQHQHPNAPYLPPAYQNHPYPQADNVHPGPNQYSQSYDTSMAAYGYNQTVPGFSAAALASGAPPLPIFQGWNQDPIPISDYTAPQNNLQYPGYSGESYSNTSHYHPMAQQQSYHQNTPYANAKPADEGELSEGEFDDGYVPPNSIPVEYSVPQYHGNGSSGYVDTAHRAVYNSTQTHSPLQPPHAGNEYYPQTRPPAVRQHSDSYSPYINYDERSRTNQQYNGYTPSHVPEQNFSATSQNYNQSQKAREQRAVSRPDSRANENQVKKAQELKKLQEVKKSQENSIENLPNPRPTSAAKSVSLSTPAQPPTQCAPPQSASSPVANATSTKSLAEARKEAQKAVLNLYPLGVRFQNFLDEGFDKAIVGRVFDDLGLSRTASNPTNGASLAQNSSSESNTEENLPLVSTDVNGSQGKAGEKLQGPVNSKATPVEQKVLSSTLASSNAAVPAKQAEPTEKELILQMKMEALRKSREQRAQKAAAKNDTSGSAPPAPISQPHALALAPTIPSQPEAPKSVAQPEPESGLPKVGTSTTTPPDSLLPEAAGQLAKSSPPSSQPITTQISTVIPGLFRTSVPASPAPITTSFSAMYGSANGIQRKRPVAADFDSPSLAPAFKRPFGHSQKETSLVIDVSEDEANSDDEDIAMDLESQADQDSSPMQAGGKMSDQRNTAIQNLPPVSNLPARKPFTPPPVASAASTPPPRKPLRNPATLQEKESQIEELRRKIAEAEAAKALKKAKLSASGTRTPQSADGSADNGKAINNGGLASKVEASVKIQTLMNIAQDQVSSDQKRLAEAQADEAQKAAELKKIEAEQKSLRRQQIATELPRVDAEAQQNQLKLEELRAEMARIEAAVQKNLEEKRRMAEEMERLGQEAEDQLQAQKDKLKDLTSAESPRIYDSPLPTSLPAVDAAITQPIAIAEQERSSESSLDLDRPVASQEIKQIDEQPALPMLTGNPASTSNGVRDEPVRVDRPRAKSIAETDNVISSTTEGRRLHVGNLAYGTTDADFQAFFKGYPIISATIPMNPRTERPVGYAFVELSTSSEAERAIAELSGRKILGREVSVQLSRKPETKPESAPSKHTKTASEESRENAAENRVLEAALQDAVRRDVGSSEDTTMEESYAPDPNQLAPESASSPMEVDEKSPSYSPNLDRPTAPSDNNDDYEPPGATPLVGIISPAAASDSPPFSPAPPEAIEDVILENTAQVDPEKSAEAVPGNSIENASDSGFEVIADDAGYFARSVPEDGTKELLPYSTGSVPPLVEETSPSNQTQYFTPYQSPLKQFRAYRFHPDFLKEVAGGLRSLTYSNKIDPLAELCPWEMAGGACNDKTCEYQHIRNIGLPDDDILKALGSQNEFTGEQRGKFIDGLRDALGAIRVKKIRDFDNIAKEIIAHRRRFLGDDSKVLPLEGTII